MLSHNEFTWKLKAPTLNKNDAPATLFEYFFTEDILRDRYFESIKYAKLRGCQSFDTDFDTLKVFITI